MSEPRDLTYQQMRKLRRNAVSPERALRVTGFADNLETAPAHEEHVVIYNIYGQGGTGKTFLMNEFRGAAERANVSTALSDDSDGDVFNVMRRLSRGLNATDHFTSYQALADRRDTLLTQLLTDRDAPDELAAALGRGSARGAILLAKQVPGAGLALALTNEGSLTAEGAKLAVYVAQKLKKPEDVTLVSDPLRTLTSAFVEGLLRSCTNERPLTLFFDVFERTAPYLEPWLLALFDGEFGDLPATLVIAVAGQQALSRLSWSEHEPFIERIPLDAFTPEEAETYLTSRGITDPAIAGEIMRLSGRLPILLATLAAESPKNPEDVGDPSGTAIDVFLRWLGTPDRRSLAIDASLPRMLNEDVMSAILSPDEAHENFAWLRETPFVQERLDGWTYHEVVRGLLLRHKRKESPESWSMLHLRLADYFLGRQKSVAAASGNQAAAQDPQWQSFQAEQFYHRLCGDPSIAGSAVTAFVFDLSVDPAYAQKLAYAIRDAGSDMGDDAVARWGTHCLNLLVGDDQSLALRAFDALVTSSDPEIRKRRAAILRLQGVRLASLGSHGDALKAFESALALKPDSVGLRADRAVALGDTGRVTEAISEVDALLTTVEAGPFSAYLHGVRAELLLNEGRLGPATDDVVAGLALAPESALLMDLRGQIYAKQGETDLAIATFRAAIKSDAKFAHGSLKRIGATLAESGRNAEATLALVDSLRHQPDCGYCWETLVKVARREHSADLAEYLRSLGLDEDMGDAGFFWRARALGGAGLFVDAVADLDHAYAAKPSAMSVEQLNQYGIWLTYADRCHDALGVFQRALDSDPQSVDVRYNLAVATVYTQGSASSQVILSSARKRLYELDEKSGTGEPGLVRAYGLAGLAAVEGESDEAFVQLRLAVLANRELTRDWAERDVAWTTLRADPRFEEAFAPSSAR